MSAVMRPAFFVPDSSGQPIVSPDDRAPDSSRYFGRRVWRHQGNGDDGAILESIVGNIQDEYDHEEEEIRPSTIALFWWTDRFP